jgi:hypothetical protein
LLGGKKCKISNEFNILVEKVMKYKREWKKRGKMGDVKELILH